jgi:uncharacterized membrane protein YuzA (DUF378 family)
MFDEKMISLIAQILLIAGALNWGALATYNMDLVNRFAGPAMGTYVKMAVAAAGIYAAYALFMSFQAPAAPAAPIIMMPPAPEQQPQPIPM